MKKVRIELQTVAVLWTLFKTAIYGRFAQVIWKGSTSIFFNVFKVDNCGQNSFTSTLTESNLAQKCLFCKSFGSSITKNLIYITYIILQSTLQHKSLFPSPLHNMIAAKSALIQFLISCIQENHGNKGEMWISCTPVGQLHWIWSNQFDSRWLFYFLPTVHFLLNN